MCLSLMYRIPMLMLDLTILATLDVPLSCVDRCLLDTNYRGRHPLRLTYTS